jgi:acetyl esterase/lipase
VFVHGGFWKPFAARMLQPLTGLHGCVGVALANHGIATAVIDYRQYPETRSVGVALDDIAHAVRHVGDTIEPHGGDPKRIFLVGHSAGGMMTALLALAPEYLERAGVPAVMGFASLGGVYDQERVVPALDATGAERVREVASADGGFARFSPERLIGPHHPPMLLIVGEHDSPALVEEQRHMRAALRNAAGEVTELEVPGEDHMDVIMHLSRANDRVLAEILSFVQRHR